MNTETQSKSARTRSPFVFLLLAALAVPLFFSGEQASRSSCPVDINMRVTIDVTNVDPKVVFDQLTQEPDCDVTVHSGIRGSVTLKVENAIVTDVLAAVCEQVECKYTFDGTDLSISRLTFLDKLIMRARERDTQARLEWLKQFEVRLPQGMYYEDATVSSVLAEISTASGLEITPWEGEGDRQVAIDVSGMTVDQALETIVRQIEGEGSVMVGTWNGGHAEHRLVDEP